MPDHVFYTIAEGGIILRCSKATMYKLIGAGELRMSKLHGKSLIAKTELDRFIAKLTPAADEA